MTKWIVSTPLKGTDLMKNFVCFTEVELQKLLEQYPEAMVEMKDSHLEDYPEMKDYSLISAAQTENYIQVNDTRYTLDEFNRVGDFLLGRELTDDQQVVLEWLKEEYKRTKWSSPFGTVYSTINIHEMFVRMRLTKAQQFQVLAAFAKWGVQLMTIGEIYKLTDAHPPAFGEVTSVTENKIWNEILEEDEQVKLAWADWYQWNEKDVYCIQGGGFEIERLVPATDDEIAVYRQKVEEYKAYWEDEG